MADTIKWSRDIYTGHITGKMPERPVEPLANDSGECEDCTEEVKAENQGL